MMNEPQYKIAVDHFIKDIDDNIICDCYEVGNKEGTEYITIRFPFKEYKDDILNGNDKIECFNTEGDCIFLTFSKWWQGFTNMYKCREFAHYINKKENRTKIFNAKN